MPGSVDLHEKGGQPSKRPCKCNYRVEVECLWFVFFCISIFKVLIRWTDLFVGWVCFFRRDIVV